MLDVLRRGLLVLLGLTLLACPVRAEDPAPEEPPPPQPLEAFLLAWVRGEATYEYFASFHKIAQGSPHRVDTEEYEVAAKACFLRRDGGDDKVKALVTTLLALHAARDTSKEVRVRVLHALGCLGDPRAVELLCRAAEAGQEPTASTAAIGSLACFGAAPRKELFLIWGGSLRSVVLPASPSEPATATLCRLMRRDPPSRIEGEERAAFRERLDRWLNDRSKVADALLSHRSREVVEAVLDELPRRRYPWRGFPWAQTKLIEALGANREHVRPEDRQRLLALRDSEEAEPRVRELAIAALEALDDAEDEEILEPGVYRYGG